MLFNQNALHIVLMMTFLFLKTTKFPIVSGGNGRSRRTLYLSAMSRVAPGLLSCDANDTA